MMIAKKFLVIGVYDGESKLVGIGVNDEKTHKTILYEVEEMGFDEVAEFLEKVAKNGEYKGGGGGGGIGISVGRGGIG